jgi:RNA polymerase sigma-70 factor, ECF subfamily
MEPLALAAQSGDRQALANLLMQHRGVVTAAVTRHAWDREQTQDIVQNALAKAVQGIAGFRGHCAFATWLYRIALNECMEANRRTARKRGRESAGHPFEALADENAPDGLAHCESAELMQCVREAVNGLPLDQRTAFSLFYFGGYTGREAARAVGITEANLFMRLKAARDRVRAALQRRGLTP